MFFTKKDFLFTFFLFQLLQGIGQDAVSCKDLKSGFYYYYMKNSSDVFLIYRGDDLQKEINLHTGDTTLWKIDWSNDCSYTLKFQSSNTRRNDEQVKFLKKHKMLYVITEIKEDYYVFKGYLDKSSNAMIAIDTVWLKEKAAPSNNQLFVQMTSEQDAKNNQFTDTSKYALLYIYRPAKLTNSLGNYLIYFDNILMCIGKNNTGYLFKILKEGVFQIKSKLYKDESSINLHVRFGNTYYVKSMIHWGIYKNLYNFKLEMAEVTAEQGRNEFEKVKHPNLD